MPFQDGNSRPSNSAEALAAHYRQIRSAVSAPERIAVLCVGADETGVALGASVDPESAIILGVGSRKTASDYFKHLPPSPGELEAAIMAVEDEVARVRELLGERAELFTTDPMVRELAVAAGQSTDAGSDVVLSVAQVERTFERLAAVSLGRPAALEGLPHRNDFAATLLIVREFMHHLEFPRVTILS